MSRKTLAATALLIWRNGGRVSFSALREGDRVYAKGFVRHGDRFALVVVARG